MRVLVLSSAVLGVVLGVGLIVVSMLDERVYPFSGPTGPTPDERLAAAVEREMTGKSFRQIDPDHDCGDCARQEAGFAYARRERMRNPDGCPQDDEDFQEGCRAYGEQVEAVEERAGY